MKRITAYLIFVVIALSLVLLPACSNGTGGQWNEPPEMTIDQSKTYTATISTDYGDIIIELFPEEAPMTVNNLVFLAQQGFYDGLIFHRVEAGILIQGGDPLGNGTGGPGYEFEDEYVDKDYAIGTVAMANSGADTNGSQFFICLTDMSTRSASFQQKAYNIFGIVTSGMNVVRKIGNVQVDANNKPLTDVIMNSVSIEE